MSSLLEGFKKNSDKDRLTRAMEVSSNNAENAKSNVDETVWSPKLNEEAGMSAFLIRFLYNPEKNDGRFYESVRSHGFRSQTGGRRWYIENCPKTQGWDKGCPACEKVEAMKDGRRWEEIPSQEQSKIRPYFASQNYWANVYILKDPENPENEGKVMKYRFGKKLLAKIQEALKDDPLTGTPGFSAFDPINGADFKLVIKKVGGFNNYDDSKFLAPGPFLGGDEAKIVDILENKLHDLSDKIGFDSYENLCERFDAVEGVKKAKPKVRKPEPEPEPEPNFEDESDDIKSSAKVNVDDSGSDEDIDENYFAKLVEDI